MIDFFYSISYRINFSAIITLYWVFAQLKNTLHSAHFSTRGFKTPCLGYPVPWQQTAFYSSTLRDVFMQTVSFLGPNVSLKSIYLPFVWWCFGLLSFLRMKDVLSTCASFNLTSFSSKPTLFILLRNTGAELCGLCVSFASWLDVRIWQ